MSVTHTDSDSQPAPKFILFSKLRLQSCKLFVYQVTYIHNLNEPSHLLYVRRHIANIYTLTNGIIKNMQTRVHTLKIELNCNTSLKDKNDINLNKKILWTKNIRFFPYNIWIP